MPSYDLPSGTRFDVKYREQYVSEALNKRQYKIDPVGIYQGFWLVKENNTTLKLYRDQSGGGLAHSIAIVESNGLAVKVEVPSDITITIDDNYVEDIYTIWLVVNYSVGVPTTGRLQVLNSTSSQPPNSIGLGCFRVLENPTRIDEVFPLHKGITSTSKSFYYQGASIGITRDLMTKHWIIQNGDFRNGFQGWQYDKAELYYISNPNDFATFEGIRINTSGVILSDLYPITTTNVYLGARLKLVSGASVFNGDILLGYILYDHNKQIIGSPIAKKVAVNGQPCEGSNYTFLGYVDKITNPNAKYISVALANSGNPIIVNKIYAVLPYDENDVYVSGGNVFYKNLIANEFQTNSIDIASNSDGYITFPTENSTDKFWIARYKSGGTNNITYDSTSGKLIFTLNSGASGGVSASIATSQKIRFNNKSNAYLRLNIEFGGETSRDSNLYLNCYVYFYAHLSDDSPTAAWQPKFGTTNHRIPFSKIISDYKSNLNLIINNGDISNFEVYKYLQVVLAFTNLSNSDQTIELKKIELFGEDYNNGAEEFTDVKITGELDTSGNVWGGKLTTNNDIKLIKLSNSVNNEIGIFSQNKGITLSIDDNNNRALKFWTYLPPPYGMVSTNVIYDSTDGITADLDVLNVNEIKGNINLGALSSINISSSNNSKIRIDNVAYNENGFASKLGANPSNNFIVTDNNIQAQIDRLAERYYPLDFQYNFNRGGSSCYSIFDVELVNDSGNKWKKNAVCLFYMGQKIKHIRTLYMKIRRYYSVPNSRLRLYFYVNSVNKYMTENGINLDVSNPDSTFVSVNLAFTTNDVDWLNSQLNKYILTFFVVETNGQPDTYDSSYSGSAIFTLCSEYMSFGLNSLWYAPSQLWVSFTNA